MKKRLGRKDRCVYLTARSAKTGRFVPLWMAFRYPDTHVTERRARHARCKP